jgi:hypothetical protein
MQDEIVGKVVTTLGLVLIRIILIRTTTNRAT